MFKNVFETDSLDKDINVIPQGFYVIEQGLWLMWLTVYFESDSPPVFALSDVTTPFNFY